MKQSPPGIKFDELPRQQRSAKIHLSILVPFTALLIFVVGLFITSTYLSEKKRNENELLFHAQAVEELFRHEVESDTRTMQGSLNTIVPDIELQRAFKSKDRKEILRRATPLFENLKRDHNISHLYFHDVDRINLIRVHKPQIYGDKITRASMLQAERTNRFSSGVEMGIFGTLTLRAVQPWMSDGELIGYVELGHDIGHFVEEVHEILGVDVLVMVYKNFVTREGWQAGSDLRSRSSDWNQFKSVVNVARTTNEIPQSLIPMLESGGHPYHSVKLLTKDRTYMHVTFLPIFDATGGEIGDLVIMRDATQAQIAFRDTITMNIATSGIAGSAVFLLFFFTLRRVERDYSRKREVEARFSKLSREHKRIVQVEKLSALGIMIGEIAHQINNPLVGVVNMAQLAQREEDNPKATAELLNDIVTAGKHCQAFVKRMVEFTRISRGHYERLGIRRLVEETVTLFRQSAKLHPDIELDFPQTPVSLEVDPVMFRHAMFNLLSNASEANGQKPGAKIIVTLEHQVRPEDQAPGWLISVRDNGPGLSDDALENIFTPFYSTRAEGTGLGLPVVEYTANLHGGTVTGANHPDGGAIFSLWLPQDRPEDVDEA
jgi:signal transduction histidine kinase